MDEQYSNSGSCGADAEGSHSANAPAGQQGLHAALDESSSSARSGDPPAPTSRISLKHVVSVIQTFSDYKKWLVEEIGFGGVLKLPDIQKLNLRCSAWIMSRVSVSRREIRLSESKVLKFYVEDVYKVFGIPCGNRSVKGRDANINP
ncbi:hypothetical protein VPH35_081414 [Triticum aestivum]